MPNTQNSPSGTGGIPSTKSSFWYSALLNSMLCLMSVLRGVFVANFPCVYGRYNLTDAPLAVAEHFD